MVITLSLVEILIVVVLNFVLGFVWYSPTLFGKSWQRETGLSDAEIGNGPSPMDMIMVAVGSAVAAIVMATLFTYVVPASLTEALIWGLMIGVGFIATAFSGNYIFEKHSRMLFALDSAYWILSTLMVAAVVFLVK